MKQLRMVSRMFIGATVAAMLTAAPAWAEVPAAGDSALDIGAATDSTVDVGTPTDPTLDVGSSADQAGLTGQAATNVKLNFPDVSKTHWALKHITKLAIEGIVEGDENGNYNPEQSVSQQDVLIMAVRMMGAEADAKSNKAAVKLPFNVSEYAMPYVVEAINKGLITIKEETDANSAGKGNWGSRSASREWVAKVMVRMLDKQADADQLASQQSAFTDNHELSPWAQGYVNEAVKLGLVNGFEDGSFQPQGSVTRAQMATLLSRSEPQMPVKSPRYTKGYVSSLSGSKISLMDQDGNTTTYKLSSDTVFYGKKDDTQISPSSIQQTYEVSLLVVNGTAYYVEVTDDQLQMDIYSGTLFGVDTAARKLYLLVDGEPQVFDLAADVSVVDANDQGSSLSSLIKDSVLELRRNRLVKSNEITQIVIKQAPVNKTSEGTIQAFNWDTRELSVLDKTTGQNEQYTLNDLVNVRLPGNVPADLNSLHVGDTVSYTVNNNRVTAISVSKQIDIGSTVQGTLIGSVNVTNGVINIRTADGSPAVYDLSETVSVNIDGKTNAGLSDLADGDEVQLELMNKKVQTINVTNSSLQNLVFAKIVSYDSSTNYLTIEDSNGVPDAYKLTDQTAIQLYGVNYTLQNFSGTFTPGKKVDIQVKKDKTVSAITMSTQLSGVITAVNSQTKQITIKSGSQYVSFSMTYSPQVEIYGIVNATLDNLKIGDAVTLDVNPSQQDVILKITATKTLMYKVVLKNAGTQQLTVSDDNGVNTAVTLDSSTVIEIPGKSAPVFADIPTDEYIKLSFKGNTITKAEVVTPVRGKVLAVDAAAGTLTIQDFSGQMEMVTLDSNATVTGSGNVPLTIGALNVNDRVQVMKDANDKTMVKVATALQKTFGSYNATLNQLSFNSPSGTDTYTLYQRAYLHQGTQQLQISSFAASDNVNIYAIDNRVIEMEKQ